MSGHSKWSTIKRKKGAIDAARSKVFQKLAKELYVAAKSGDPDPANNASLRMVVEKDHYNELDSVLVYFIDKVKEYKNIGTAYVTSAAALSDSQKAAVEKKLLETTKYVWYESRWING